MQARYYDPVIGRFYSNDPVGWAPKKPVISFNRYLYVNNNPYKYQIPHKIFPINSSSSKTEIMYQSLTAVFMT